LFLVYSIILTTIPRVQAAEAFTPDRESIEDVRVGIPAGRSEPVDAREETPGVPRSGRIAPWPTTDWSTSTPEAEGMDRNTLIGAFHYAVENESRAVLVIRHGYIVGEWYGEGWDEATRQQGFSMTKSFSSALVGMLIDDGVIGDVEQPVARFVPEWRDDEHGQITIRHLLSMDSGLFWSATMEIRFFLQNDQNAFAVGLPVAHPPGDVWIYSNPACQVLSEVILNATGGQAAEYGQQRLFDVIGMWNATWDTDPAGNTLTYMGIVASAREFAKFGYLFLRDGAWEDGQIVSADWVRESTIRSQWLQPFYGYLWWLNTNGVMWRDVPGDAYAALGAEEKKIYVVPSLDIIAIRLGDAQPAWSDNTFLGRVCRSVIER